MKRYLADEIIDGVAFIRGGENDHLRRVMREKVGNEVIVNNSDTSYEGGILEITESETKVAIFRKLARDNETKVDITAYCALIKGDHETYLVQKLTELGVKHFVPFESSRTIVKDTGNKSDRLQSIADQAIKQCGRTSTMQVSKTRALKDILKDFKDYDAVYFANTSEDAVHLKNIPSNIRNIAFIIGPEGGFSPDEIKSIIDLGAISITLGDRILRADTAGIVTATLILCATGEI